MSDMKFSVNAVRGTASCSIPFAFPFAQNGYTPSLALSYDPRNGNGTYGPGWEARPSAITRKTGKQLPVYQDDEDVFLLAGAEDLVPVYVEDDGSNWAPDIEKLPGMTMARYRPRVESAFSRIEKVTEAGGTVYWKVTSGTNVVSIYGKSAAARIDDPADPSKIFSWLLEFSYDDKGNCWQLDYKSEEGVAGVNRYLKRVCYDNSVPFDRMSIRWDDWEAFLSGIDYLLEAVWDYGEHDAANPQPDDRGVWLSRADAFSSYRPGFEIRTRQLCRRVLFFRRREEGRLTSGLVDAMELAYEEGPAFSFLKSVTQRGLPPVTFDYSGLRWNTNVQTRRADPWIDLYGEGLSGVLTEQGSVRYYKRNTGSSPFDGIANILITEDEVFTWYPATEKEEEKGPELVFADRMEALFLADMSGDGLPDIVRVRNGEICYWPNLGHGQFGVKVSMSGAPEVPEPFDAPEVPESFDARNVRLYDLDGSGTTDLVYLRADTFSVYFNQAGNSWSTENRVEGVHAGALRGIDLAGGVKPHLLTGYTDGRGGEVRWEYTRWVTKLPVVVHCVRRVIRLDAIRKTRSTQEYSYHHGYYDPAEREFRGFGRVERMDTESVGDMGREAAPAGAVLTKTWFHTGVFLNKESVLDQFAHEYYRNKTIPEKNLPDPILPPGLSIDEWREALRACKGIVLRSEVYSADGNKHPHTTTRQSCLVRLLQPRLGNRHGIFQVQLSESMVYRYEGDPAGPRVSHTMTLTVDPFGHVLQKAVIAYGRQPGETDVTITENLYTYYIDTPEDYVLPMCHDAESHELTGMTPAAGDYFEVGEIIHLTDQTVEHS